MIEKVVSEDAAGQRLDKFLQRVLPAVPVSHLYKLLRTRQVRVNGQRAKGDRLLNAGDRVAVRGTPEALLGPAPQGRQAPLPLDQFKASIVYEDQQLLAVNKPAGLAVHPGSGIEGATLVDLARAYVAKPPEGEFEASPGHRLDRDTSGVVLVAKTRRCMVRLVEIFTEGSARKRYLALAKGRFSETNGIIELPLAEHQQTRRSREERGVNLQVAVTHYRALAEAEAVTLLECRIETGRTHQIRRHLAAVGHPITGDRRYGDFAFNRRIKAESGLRRMFLHSAALELAHPITGHPLRLEAPLPDELAAPLRALGIAWPLSARAS